uniref:CUB domain-containing protein n=1 Tax=Panagrolaimus sp. ES5 TaxID=591445 RepID=A0AC34G460_9BILA
MESDTVVFFESPDFPRHMTIDEIGECYLNFTKTPSFEESNKRFVIVTTNILCGGQYRYDGTINGIWDYKAFQGFAYFDDWADDCPLESVSRIDPFKFTNPDEVIVVRSTYDPSTFRNQSCLWQFKAPENYGFKIVISELNILNSTIFKVENIQDTIIT